jgi:hypothetical protein
MDQQDETEPGTEPPRLFTFVCHGFPRCEISPIAINNGEAEPCPYCYRLSIYDERSPEEIRNAMKVTH